MSLDANRNHEKNKKLRNEFLSKKKMMKEERKDMYLELEDELEIKSVANES
jgi:hypothetical protein